MVAHQHFLRGAGFVGGAGAAPTLLQRTDQELIPAILGELATEQGRAALARTVADRRDENGVLRLFQPVHRTFHVALVEAACADFGTPRVDPARVESAGLVVRRLVRSAGDFEVQGWMRAGDALRGWVPLSSQRALDQDPDPERRLPLLRAGHPKIDRALSASLGLAQALEETVSPLFVAPPEVCRAARRTLLYGIVPVVSSELSEAPAPPPAYSLEDARATLPGFLRTGTHTVHLRREDEAGTITGLALLMSLGAFEESGRALFDRLEAIPARRKGASSDTPLGQALRHATGLFSRTLAPDPAEETTWTVSRAQEDALAEAMRRMNERWVAGITPQLGRYDARGVFYQVRAFVRLRAESGCPPELVWSAPSPRFTIVPWFESGDTPPLKVVLPEASPAALKKLKPTVSFFTPQSVADLMNGVKLPDVMEGKKGGPALGLDWICSFSIPIITLCAFIVLNLFLQLLNIIFWWLPFVKICIPLPRISSSERP